jgi:hypothetical protein
LFCLCIWSFFFHFFCPLYSCLGTEQFHMITFS